MKMSEAFEELNTSKEYNEFQKENKSYLAHAFAMFPAGEEPKWQFGYYNESTDKIISFETDPVKQLPEEEVFKKEGTLKQLDMTAVKIKAEEAIEKAMTFQKEKFSAEQITRTILILQHLDIQLYNFTLVSSTLNMLNVRIDATTGEVYSHQLQNILSLRKE